MHTHLYVYICICTHTHTHTHTHTDARQLLAFEVWLNMHPSGGQFTLVSPSALPQALAAAAAVATPVPVYPATPLAPGLPSLNTSSMSLTSAGAANALSTHASTSSLPAPQVARPAGPPVVSTAAPAILAAPEQLPVVLQVLLSQQHRCGAVRIAWSTVPCLRVDCVRR
jgi:hypothetical protein